MPVFIVWFIIIIIGLIIVFFIDFSKPIIYYVQQAYLHLLYTPI